MKSPLSLTINRPFAMRAVDILSTLNCLNYLTSEEAEDSAKVRHYASMTQERLHAFAELIGPMLWIPKPAAA
jgi:hypothetical protein